MPSQKKQEKKKKERERIAKARVMRRRIAIRAAAKEENDRFKKQKELKKMVAKDVRERKKFESMSEVEKMEHIRNRLYHNLEVLKGLEDEFVKESMAREDLNRELESEGHLTLPQKLEALKKRFVETTGVNTADITANITNNIDEFVKAQIDVLGNNGKDDIVDAVLDEKPTIAKEEFSKKIE